jgi:hypothetical protein
VCKLGEFQIRDKLSLNKPAIQGGRRPKAVEHLVDHKEPEIVVAS